MLLLTNACGSKTAQIPEGMVLIPGGKHSIGNNNAPSNSLEYPAADTLIKAFYMDAHLVTVHDFTAFVQQTGFVTEAERFGNAGVFDFKAQVWTLKDSANWRYPQGRDYPAAPLNHPVTQVSWHDAVAFCQWKNKRLPTEAEWEAAAKLNNNGQYSWGAAYCKDGKPAANVWTGSFPDTNNLQDGFLLTSPVGHYGKNAAGLSDMGGNVWQWCADAQMPYPGFKGAFHFNPHNKVLRGGSFLCDSTICHGYRTTARNASTGETSLMHVGFRCACDAE